MPLEIIRPGVQFRPDAAASFRRLERALGRPVDVNRTVVPYAEQMRLYKLREAGLYPYSVAHPDVSNHVYRTDWDGGNAWDTDERGAELEEHGWIAVWNDPNRSPFEPWHREYFASRDRHRNSPIPASISNQENDMFIAIVRKKDWYLVTGGKACLLGAASGARDSGAPILEFVDDWAVQQLRTVVSGIK